MATPQQDNRTTQEKSANSVLDASGLNDLDDDDALAMNWQDGDEPDAQRNLRDELDRAKTPTPTELVVWKKPRTDREQAPRERKLEEFDKIIEDGTAITLELYEEAPEREELAKFSLPQMADGQFEPLERPHKNTDTCPLFGCGWSHTDYKHLRGHLTAHREQLLKDDAWKKEGYPADMLRSIDGKKVSRDNIENVKIFKPQIIKRRGCPESDANNPEKWEEWEKFADRVFNATQVDASAAKRLWYKRSEVHARLQKWIYDLNLSSHQEYEVKRETHPRELFYNKDGRKRYPRQRCKPRSKSSKTKGMNQPRG